MERRDVVVQIRSGMDTRPVAKLVQVASQFRSDTYLETGNKRVNAKSIMGMMSLGLIAGESVTVVTNGEDEAKAAEAITNYLLQAG